MAPTTKPAGRRARRLLATAVAAASLITAISVVGGSLAASADQAGPAPGPLKKPTPSPTATESPTATPTGCYFGFDCPSPSPTPLTVSPVPADSPMPSPSEPYLQGTNPTPSPSPSGVDVISSPVPVGGGFVDQLPTPSGGASQVPTNDLAPHSSGLPLPFLAVGAFLILGALGSLIYAVAPRNKPIFPEARRPAPASPVLFTPYGPETPGSNILSGPQSPQPGPRSG